MGAYDGAVRIHHLIEKLYPAIEKARALFRDPRRIARSIPVPSGANLSLQHDPIYCALAVKAATTKRATHVMCEAGDGDSAMILARAVMENGVMMAWMLDGPGLVRLETFAIFGAALQAHLIRKIQTFYTDRAELMRLAREKSDPFTAAIAKQVFGGRDDSWAYFPNEKGKLTKTTVKAMFEELQGTGSFAYAVPYARASQFVHTGPLSVNSAAGRLRQATHFEVTPMPSTEYREEALSISNVGMLLAMKALSDYTGIDINDHIERIRDAMIANAAEAEAQS